jgi:hypothetical protein
MPDMPNQHKTPLVGWHPPADLLARIKAEVKRRGGTRSDFLTTAVTEHLATHDAEEDQP